MSDKISLPALFVLLLITVSCMTAQRGSDHQHYDRWSKAIVVGDMIGEVEGAGPDLPSVKGVQFRHWSAGPALLIAVFRVLLSPVGLSEQAAFVAGYFSICTFWWLLFLGLRRISNDTFALIYVAAAYIGTGLGFYSCYISLETYALLPTGLIVHEVSKRLVGERTNLLLVATSAGLLLMFRSFLASYTWCLLLPILAEEIRSGDGLSKKLLRLVVLVTPIFAAFWQLGTVHWWMTGDPLRNPYSFGDEQFRSIDSSCPFIWEVLFSSFHGALVSSPLTALGILVCLFLTATALRSRSYGDALVWGMLIAAVACNVYVAGCWHNWWMAAWFGNRNLYLPGAVAILALAYHSFRAPRIWQWAELLACSVFSGYSFLLLQRGRVSYVEYSRIFYDVAIDLKYWTRLDMIGVLALCVPFALLIVLSLRMDRDRWLVGLCAFFVVYFSLLYLADRMSVVGANSIVFVACVLLMLLISMAKYEWLVILQQAVACILLVCMVLMFARLHSLTYGRTYENPNGQSYPDYDLEYNINSVKGMDVIAEERERMIEFLRRQKGEDWYKKFREGDQDRRSPIETRYFPESKLLKKYRYL